MSLDYDLTGFSGAGTQLNWPSIAVPQPAHVANQLTSQRQQTSAPRHSGHALAASHALKHTGIGHSGHGAGHHPARPQKRIQQQKALPFGEKAF